MQKTRQKILEYLREHQTATVDALSEALGNLTAVTVRHHLDVLQQEGLVDTPHVQHRSTPGRPKFVYQLTDRAHQLFPRNLSALTNSVFDQIKQSLPNSQVNVIFEGVADRMAAELPPGPAGEPFEKRLDRVVDHLSDHGYEAAWEESEGGYLLHTTNCPYSGVADESGDLCGIDMRYISKLLGRVPRRTLHMQDGDATCSYLIAAGEATAEGISEAG